ncbi:MAG: MEMO1 family protein [Nitrososphaerota archaeon]
MRNRKPAVAGQFYQAEKNSLIEEIKNCFMHPVGPGSLPPAPDTKQEILATLNPHAGYMYSGPVAAHSFYAISRLRPDLIIIIGPNHYGIGSGVAVPQSDGWETPLGNLKIDVYAARELMKTSGIVDMDDAAHWREHSIEVQLPFIQFVFGEFVKILPISMALQDHKTSIELGEAVARLARGKNVILIASSDFTHYEPHETAKAKDSKALEYILAYDVAGFYGYIERSSISMCGYGPVAAVIVAAKMLGADKSKLLRYATSGDISGERSSVVGYSSAIFFR